MRARPLGRTGHWLLKDLQNSLEPLPLAWARVASSKSLF